MPRSKVATLLSLATLLTVPALAQNANPARPGTLNYVEGSASIDGRALTSHSVGNTELEAGSMLATANGKAEVLLTPGVYLRVGENSTIRMVSPNLTHTEMEVQRGRAEVEADQVHKQNEILIDVQGGQAKVLNGGLYEFDADRGTIRVFDGKAAVFPGSHADNSAKPVEVKGGRELAMNGPTAKTVKFDKNASASDDLYKWSSLRSDYLGQANEGIAERYAGASGFRSGWFWDNSLYGYTWLPGDGMFFSPFGYGFYSPYYIYGGGPLYGGYYGGGYYGGAYGRGGYNYGRGGYLGNRGGYGGGVHPGGTPGGGFHGGVGGGAGGGGFHGGGGGGSHGGGGHR